MPGWGFHKTIPGMRVFSANSLFLKVSTRRKMENSDKEERRGGGEGYFIERSTSMDN